MVFTFLHKTAFVKWPKRSTVSGRRRMGKSKLRWRSSREAAPHWQRPGERLLPADRPRSLQSARPARRDPPAAARPVRPTRGTPRPPRTRCGPAAPPGERPSQAPTKVRRTRLPAGAPRRTCGGREPARPTAPRGSTCSSLIFCFSFLNMVEGGRRGWGYGFRAGRSGGGERPRGGGSDFPRPGQQSHRGSALGRPSTGHRQPRPVRLRSQRGAERFGRHGARRGTNFRTQCPVLLLSQRRRKCSLSGPGPARTSPSRRGRRCRPGSGVGGGVIASVRREEERNSKAAPFRRHSRTLNPATETLDLPEYWPWGSISPRVRVLLSRSAIVSRTSFHKLVNGSKVTKWCSVLRVVKANKE